MAFQIRGGWSLCGGGEQGCVRRVQGTVYWSMEFLLKDSGKGRLESDWRGSVTAKTLINQHRAQ